MHSLKHQIFSTVYNITRKAKHTVILVSEIFILESPSPQPISLLKGINLSTHQVRAYSTRLHLHPHTYR